MKKLCSLAGTLIASLFFYGYALSDANQTLKGQIVDASSGEPISFVYLHLNEINRSTTTDRNGNFQITNIPAGSYTLTFHRIGYAERTINVTISHDEVNEITVQLVARAVRGDEVEVVAAGDGLTGANLRNANIKLTGEGLRQNLSQTVSQTLLTKPGFHQRTMGTTTGRPVIRGLGGERVLMLQDGERTGDVSSTSADHAVSIDPISANEIEVARGPAAFAYGSNAVGGVVNVVRNLIATSVPSSFTGTANLQGATVNSGLSGSGTFVIPKDDWVVNLDLNGRFGGDFQSPVGKIENSGYASTNSAAGVSYIRTWGYSGLSISTFISHYGIPPDPLGGHPNAVDIEMEQFQIENKNEFVFDDRFFNIVETQVSFRHYNHQEFETTDIIGTEFITNTLNVKAVVNHNDIGFLENGRIGVWGEFQDYTVIDRANIETLSYSGSLFGIQEIDLDPLQIEIGLRLESHVVEPKNPRFTSLLGQIERRSFLALASSASATYDIGSGWSIGSILMHSFRPPSSEELFSQGPHIAAFSFEIGNPELDAERAFAKELFLSYSNDYSSFRVTGYHNDFSNYNYPRDTGRQSVPFPTLNEFQFEGVEAVIKGIEGELQADLLNRFTIDLSASYTEGTREILQEEQDLGIESETSPLPMIPPFTASAGLTYNNNRFRIGANVEYSAEQNRIELNETPTDSYTLVNLHTQYQYTTNRNLLHTLSLRVNNLFDVEHRNHLSRIKEVFPEPGISISGLYRVYF